MTIDNMAEWMDIVAFEPFAAKVFFRELFTAFYPGCSCRIDGKMIVTGRINNCKVCFRHLGSLDAHMFLANLDFAMLSWLSTIWKGKICKYKTDKMV